VVLTATVSTFDTGGNVVAGGATEQVNQLFAYTYLQRLSLSLGQELRMYNFRTQNIVCSADLGYPLNLDWILLEANDQGYGNNVFYNPDEFVGLSWLTLEKGVKIMFVVFLSGCVVAAGMQSMSQIPITQERMVRLVAPFKAGNEPVQMPAHARDSATLSSIKAEVASASKGTMGGGKPVARVNAASRSQRKVNADVHQMMRQTAMAVVMGCPSSAASDGEAGGLGDRLELTDSFRKLVQSEQGDGLGDHEPGVVKLQDDTDVQWES
jgi:TATA-box binding protein (TBP) (component of TFIID and TFIIIB)